MNAKQPRMRPYRPPAAATLLLERLGPQDDGIRGDLTEEWQAGRSALWYWRQAIAAIVVAAVSDLRRHRLLVLRGVAVGWLATWVCRGLIGRPLNRLLRGWVLDQLIFTLRSHPFVMVWATDFSVWPGMMIVNLIGGWIVARWHREHAGVLLAFVLVTFGRALDHVVTVDLIRITSTSGNPTLPNPVLHLASQTLIPPLFALIGVISALDRRAERQLA
jgi:hypothetical protein